MSFKLLSGRMLLTTRVLDRLAGVVGHEVDPSVRLMAAVAVAFIVLFAVISFVAGAVAKINHVALEVVPVDIRPIVDVFVVDVARP